MASYVTDHALALAELTEAGESVTFTVTNPGTLDEATGLYSSGSTSTMAGYAVQEGGNLRRYQALGLVQENPVTLLFAPSTYGNVPSLGATVSWNSTTYRVRDVEVITPNATAILSRVIVTR